MPSKLFFALTAFLSACTTWSVKDPTPQGLPRATSPGEHYTMRVTLRSGVIMSVRDPWVEHDSLRWPVTGMTQNGHSTRTAGVPLKEVAEVAWHHFDAGKTAAGLGFFALLAALAFKDFNPLGGAPLIGGGQ